MFARKFQRLAEEHRERGAVFLEILGDETPETRVSSTPTDHKAHGCREAPALRPAQACQAAMRRECCVV